MLRSFEYRIYPNPSQAVPMDKHIGTFSTEVVHDRGPNSVVNIMDAGWKIYIGVGLAKSDLKPVEKISVDDRPSGPKKQVFSEAGRHEV